MKAIHRECSCIRDFVERFEQRSSKLGVKQCGVGVLYCLLIANAEARVVESWMYCRDLLEYNVMVLTVHP